MPSMSERARALDACFADNLHAARTGNKLSRQQLAALTGIPAHSIERIETGRGDHKSPRRSVSIGEAIVLAEALKVRPGYLLRESVPNA